MNSSVLALSSPSERERSFGSSSFMVFTMGASFFSLDSLVLPSSLSTKLISFAFLTYILSYLIIVA